MPDALAEIKQQALLRLAKLHFPDAPTIVTEFHKRVASVEIVGSSAAVKDDEKVLTQIVSTGMTCKKSSKDRSTRDRASSVNRSGPSKEKATNAKERASPVGTQSPMLSGIVMPKNPQSVQPRSNDRSPKKTNGASQIVGTPVTLLPGSACEGLAVGETGNLSTNDSLREAVEASSHPSTPDSGAITKGTSGSRYKVTFDRGGRRLRAQVSLIRGKKAIFALVMRGSTSTGGLLCIKHRIPFDDLCMQKPPVAVFAFTAAKKQAQNYQEYAEYFRSKCRAGVADLVDCAYSLYVITWVCAQEAGLVGWLNITGGYPLTKNSLIGLVAESPSLALSSLRSCSHTSMNHVESAEAKTMAEAVCTKEACERKGSVVSSNDSCDMEKSGQGVTSVTDMTETTSDISLSVSASIDAASEPPLAGTSAMLVRGTNKATHVADNPPPGHATSSEDKRCQQDTRGLSKAKRDPQQLPKPLRGIKRPRSD